MGLGGYLTWTAVAREIHQVAGTKVFPFEMQRPKRIVFRSFRSKYERDGVSDNAKNFRHPRDDSHLYPSNGLLAKYAPKAKEPLIPN